MKTAALKIKFHTVLDKFSPESGWHFVGVSREIAGSFEFAKGSRRVICTLNGAETFPCALMPYDGSFFLMVNKSIRTRLGIEAGDSITVELEKDESKYGLPMPEELQEVLNQDPEGDKLFHSLTPGKQRSILYFVGKVKDIDKRIHTALIFVDHLKQNNGKIDHARLQQELKRPMI
jgi:bifunctional DNA-binding transcriptional regulator/antitoxin component of YhaV-PrlF toxin-antitoxin module